MLALTTAGVPYVAYMLEDMPGYVKSAVRDGDAWCVATVAEGYFYGPLDIAIGPDDATHISYHDHQANQFRPNMGDAAYAVLQDGSWAVEAVSDSGHDGWDNRIVIDQQGLPHMSAIDPQDFGGDGVEYYRLDSAGDWLVESVGSGLLTYKYATSIAVDPEGGPHITYFDQRGGNLALASRDAAGWNITVVDDRGDTGLFSSLVITPDGRFHVSYLQRTSQSSGVVKYATRGAGESAWEVREVGELVQLAFCFIGARNITSMAVDSGGNPWIAYSDESRVSVAVWTGSDWSMELVVEAGRLALGQLVSLKLDGDGRQHITYFEVTGESPLTGLVKYSVGTPK